MPVRITRRGFLAAGAAAAARLALGGGPGPVAAGGARGPARWRHATIPPRADSVFQLMAIEKGFFKEVGLDVEMVYVESGATVVQLLVANEVDTIDIAPSGTLVSISRGARIKVVGSTAWAVPYVLYAKGDIKSLKDLGGRTVAISQPGALAEVLASAMMQKEGLDAKALGVQWVSVGGDSARMQALLAGRVDATINHVEFAARAQQAGYKIIASTWEMLPNYVRFATVASEKTLRDRFDELVRFCTALTRGIRYCMEHRDETIELGVRTVKRDRDDVARTYDWFAQTKGLEPNFNFPPEGLRYLQELNVRLGSQSRILPPEEMATWEVQKRVVAALGPYKR